LHTFFSKFSLYLFTIIRVTNQYMEKKPIFKNSRVSDPYVDRRSAEDRRQVYDADYWESGGRERRSIKDRRQHKERRSSCVNVFKWSSVCAEYKTDQ
jgi:hypothetical protein